MRFPVTLVLYTPRLRLRHVSLRDLPQIWSASRHPGFNEGMVWEPPNDQSELMEPHQRACEAWSNDEYYCFTIADRETDEMIGRIVIRPDPDSGWNLGYWTHPLHQGKGYMSEAAARMLDFGFNELNANRITAAHALWNAASRRVLEKIGMHFIEHIPHGFLKRGEWVAEDKLAIARSQWQQAKR